MNRRQFVSTLVPAGAAAALARPAFGAVTHEWPSFRGPQATGIAEKANPPVTWKDKQYLWSTPIPGVSHSSPVVWGDRIFLLTATAQSSSPADTAASAVDLKQNDQVVFAKDLLPHTWSVLALDRKSGRILWQTPVHSATPAHARHVRGSYANATPATDGKHVAVAVYQDRLACLDAAGRLLWTKPINPPQPSFALDPASSPIFHDGMLIMLLDWERDGYLAAWDPASGREVWRTPRSERMTWTTPVGYRTPSGESVIVVNSSRWVRAYLAKTGEEIWRLNNSVKEPWDRIPAPVITARHIIVTGGSPDQPIYAIRHTARGDITPPAGTRTNEHIAWATERGAPYMITPLAYNDLLYVLASNGVLTVYGEANGERIYQQRIGPAGTLVAASPIAASGRIYFAAESGEVVVLRAGRTFEVLGRSTVPDAVLATPAIAGRLLLIRGLRNLYAIGRA